MNYSFYTVFLLFLAVFGLFSFKSEAQQQPPKPATVTAVKPGAASPQQKPGANKDSSESDEDDKTSPQHQKTNATAAAAPPAIPAFCQQNAADPAVQKCCTALKTAAAAHKVQGSVKLPECVQCGQKCNNAPAPVNGAAHPPTAANAPKLH